MSKLNRRQLLNRTRKLRFRTSRVQRGSLKHMYTWLAEMAFNLHVYFRLLGPQLTNASSCKDNAHALDLNSEFSKESSVDRLSSTRSSEMKILETRPSDAAVRVEVEIIQLRILNCAKTSKGRVTHCWHLHRLVLKTSLAIHNWHSSDNCLDNSAMSFLQWNLIET
jgi:hypothetical protein